MFDFPSLSPVVHFPIVGFFCTIFKLSVAFDFLYLNPDNLASKRSVFLKDAFHEL